MKIGIDARVLMDKQYSGVSEYAANLLSALLKADKENKYILFYNSFKTAHSRLDRWKKHNTKLVGTRYPNKIFNYLLQKIFKYPKLDEYIGDTDIFFAPHFNFINISKKTKFIITVHDVSFLRYGEFFSWRKNFWHWALNIKKLLHRADKIVAVSENTKNDLVELLSLPEDKIKVIYSGANFSPSVVSEKEKIDKFLKEKYLKQGYILFLSNIEPRKNIINLIKAYNYLREERNDLKDIQLVIAGAPGWKHEKIFETWHKSEYKNDIKFLGYIDEDEKELLYSGARVFAYPSFYEGFGFPPLEAMSFQVPVVSSNVSSLPEVLGNSALLIDPFRAQELKDALIMALTNEDVRQRLITRGIKKVQEFNWEKTALSYLDLFKELGRNE